MLVPSLSPPSDLEVARLLVAVRRRIVRLVRRHGVELENGEGGDRETADLLSLDSPTLATIQGASVLGRVATGPRAGRWVVRLGHDPRAPVVITGGPRQAHHKSFDLHANTAVGAEDRSRLEHLCRYVLRPPLAQDALKGPKGDVPSLLVSSFAANFAVDVLACPECGGASASAATIE